MEEKKMLKTAASTALQPGLTSRINDSMAIPRGPKKKEQPLADRQLSWSELVYGDRKFVFNKELVIRVTQEEGAWVFKSEQPKLVGFDLELDGAELAFRQTFVACWDNIAQEDDENLTQGAIQMKQTLLAFAKEL